MDVNRAGYEGVSGYGVANSMNLAKRQQDFEFAERRARLVFEMARDLGKDVVPLHVIERVIADLMAVD